MAGITIDELEKAARNIERISTFIGERRDWKVGDGGETMATAIRARAGALAEILAEKIGEDPDPEIQVDLPPKLAPAAEISADRLAKFDQFLGQLTGWFAAQEPAKAPGDCREAIHSIHSSLALMCRVTDDLLESMAADEPMPAIAGRYVDGIGSSQDLKIDPSARLVLEDTENKPLLQTFKGISELTDETKDLLGDFLASQSIELEPDDLRRLHDRLLKWIEGVPLNQVLVVKASGLYGKPSIFSSYQPKGNIDAADEEDST
ncbi:MAG: hypothetical protein LJE93_02155 [Acidobacteria bacterium]|nr:hypothetical protein [Acidobacteriota bacterium]